MKNGQLRICNDAESSGRHALVVTGGTLYLFGERRTVKARSLAADPRHPTCDMSGCCIEAAVVCIYQATRASN